MTSSLPESDPPPDLSESMFLVKRAQGGEGLALDQLLTRYQDRLRRIVRIRLGARLRANLESMDIVQEAMAVAARKINEADLSSSGSILNWLSRIAENKIHDAHDYFTAQRRDRGREAPMHLVVSGESIGWEPPDQNSTPSAAAEKSEVEEIVDQALTELSEAHREVVLLRHYCGTPWEEVAAALDRSVPAAQELHRRAWERLRELVRPRLQGWSD